MATIHRQHVQTQFLEWKHLNSKLNFIEIYSLGSNWQYVSIGSDNGVAPPRRQAITLPEPMLTQFTDAYMPH